MTNHRKLLEALRHEAFWHSYRVCELINLDHDARHAASTIHAENVVSQFTPRTKKKKVKHGRG